MLQEDSFQKTNLTLPPWLCNPLSTNSTLPTVKQERVSYKRRCGQIHPHLTSDVLGTLDDHAVLSSFQIAQNRQCLRFFTRRE